MQGGAELTGNDLEMAKHIYGNALRDALRNAKQLAALPNMPHKQLINRILEPYSHITVVVTSSHWANWFALRDHSAAEPHMEILAKEMRAALDNSTPTRLGHGDWHLPYIGGSDDELHHAAIHVLEDDPRLGDNEENLAAAIWQLLAKVSVARCARVSYLNHDGTAPRLLKDLQLYADLMTKHPLHASPAEHQAQPDRLIGPTWESPHLWGNFHGWKQYRKYHLNECVADKPYADFARQV
jgi:hypothetical protein